MAKGRTKEKDVSVDAQDNSDAFGAGALKFSVSMAVLDVARRTDLNSRINQGKPIAQAVEENNRVMDRTAQLTDFRLRKEALDSDAEKDKQIA